MYPTHCSRITVLGAGSWGTALAILLASNGHTVSLWDRDSQHTLALNNDRVNQRYLPGIKLPENLQAIPELRDALVDANYILSVIPSSGFRNVLKKLVTANNSALNFIWASKGLEPGTGKFLHEVVAEELPDDSNIAVLSGPSFAAEVARGMPTAVTIASNNLDYASAVATLFHCPNFRTYTSSDLVGVELGGSIKNVLAIAAGISDGLGYGANARAALITRGLAEIMRLGTHLGGQRDTFMGLAGVGDLVLTCTDDQSRNRRLGLALGRGIALDEAVQTIGQAVEGLHTARELNNVAEHQGIDMPITHQVKRVLFDNKSPAAAVDTLLSRDAKPEVI